MGNIYEDIYDRLQEQRKIPEAPSSLGELLNVLSKIYPKKEEGRDLTGRRTATSREIKQTLRRGKERF